MTNDLIARARAALDGVTPSKMPSLWRVTKRYSFISHKDTWQVVRDVPNSTAIDTIADTGGSGLSDERNARFIAAARDLVPALVDEVERLTKERDAIERAFMDSCDAYDEQCNAFYQAEDRAESAEAKVANLHKVCSEYEAKIGEEWQGRLAAEAKVTKLVEALRRIREAWPTVRDAEGSGGTISAAIDEIDAALAEIEGDQK